MLDVSRGKTEAKHGKIEGPSVRTAKAKCLNNASVVEIRQQYYSSLRCVARTRMLQMRERGSTSARNTRLTTIWVLDP